MRCGAGRVPDVLGDAAVRAGQGTLLGAEGMGQKPEEVRAGARGGLLRQRKWARAKPHGTRSRPGEF